MLQEVGFVKQDTPLLSTDWIPFISIWLHFNRG